MLLSLFVVLSLSAQARDITHYFAACKDGSLHYVGHEKEMTFEDAERSGWSLCDMFILSDRGENNYRGIYSRQAPHNDYKKIFYELTLAYEKKVYLEIQEKIAYREQQKRLEDERKADLELEERRDCSRKKTKPAIVYACPLGSYALHPSNCEVVIGHVSTGAHAVELDTGIKILPEGQSCQISGKTIDSAYLDEALLCSVNNNCSRNVVPLTISVDLKEPLKKAKEDWSRADQENEKKKTYDCLAGVCLNAPASSISSKLVTVSEVVMHRAVEVCSGRIVRIRLWAGWVEEGYGGWVDVLPGAQHKGYNYGAEKANNHMVQMDSELAKMGWVVGWHKERRVHPSKMGWRIIESAEGGNGGSWLVSLESIHADHLTLCEQKRQEGL
jgi:hypothetical protein